MKIRIECPACDATGIYVGLAEREGAAVVCSKCHGTGYQDIEVTPFEKRKVRDDVVRVYDSNPGWIIVPETVKMENGTVVEYGKWGCSYEDWLDGATPEPIKDLVCPYQHVGLAIGREPLERCRENMGMFSCVFDCRSYPNKCFCWEELDALKAAGSDDGANGIATDANASTDANATDAANANDKDAI